MKKLLIFFILISLIGCSSIGNQSKKIVNIDCPNVFFSSENSVYVKGEKNSIEIEGLSYKASLNNYGFVEDCLSAKDYDNYTTLELLILVEPLNPENKIVNLPIFALIYDSQDRLIDRQYFKIDGELNYNTDLSAYEFTEFTGTINIYVGDKKEVASLTIGFVKTN